MDRNPVVDGRKSEDFIPEDRIATLGQLIFDVAQRFINHQSVGIITRNLKRNRTFQLVISIQRSVQITGQNLLDVGQNDLLLCNLSVQLRSRLQLVIFAQGHHRIVHRDG